MKCPMCEGEMRFLGYDIVVKDVDIYGEPESFGITEVYACDNCKIVVDYDVTEDLHPNGYFYSEDEAYCFIVEELQGEIVKEYPEGYKPMP